MKKLVVVSALEPDAHGTGKAVVWSGLWQYVAMQYFGSEVTYVVVGPSSAEASDLASIGSLAVDVVRIRKPSGPEQAINLIDAMWRGRPFQEAALGGRRVREELRSAIKELAPDLLLIDTYRLGVHLTDLDTSVKAILYMEDLFSVRYERMLEAMAARPELPVHPLGNFSAVLPPIVGRIIAKRPLSTLLLKSEARRVRRTELEAPGNFDLSLLVNPDEAALLSQLSCTESVRPLPPIVKVDRVLKRQPSEAAPRYVFLGALNVPHNEAGLVTFLREALPRLLNERPDVRLEIVGRGAGEELLAIGKAFGSSVHFHGFVDNLDGLLSEATAMLVPLVFGSGIKIKVLEALGRGLPVVATSFGAEGLARNPQGADGLFVADDWGIFLKYATELIDPERNQAASTQAREHFLSYYGPEAIARSYYFAL